MKKLFFKRHYLFFVTLVILMICQVLILCTCVRVYKRRVIHQESIKALRRTLGVQRRNLPDDHIIQEQQKRRVISEYKNFIAGTWSKLSHLPCIRNPRMIPPNYIALFFSLSDYIAWSKDCCDALTIEYDGDCSFGLQDFLEKQDEHVAIDIADVYQQKEQLKLLLSYLMEAKASYLKILSVKRSGNIQASFFDNKSVFNATTNHLIDSRTFTYQIKFSAFTSTFRNFLNALVSNEIPVIFREISISPSYTLKLKSSNDEILDCRPSNFSMTIEFIDIPSEVALRSHKNASIFRRMIYESAQ